MKPGEVGIITFIQRSCVADGPGIRTTVFLKGCRLKCKWCHNPEGVRHYPEVFHFWANCEDCGDCDDVCPSGALSIKERFEFGGDTKMRDFPSDTGRVERVPVTLRRKTVRKMRIDKGLCINCFQCVEACEYGAFVIAGEFMTVDDVLNEVEEDKLFYQYSGGGMTLSGGEPTAQPDFAYALLKGAKERGIHTALDTCGYQSWNVLNRLLDYTDLVLYDIKYMDPKAHKDLTGVSNELILENAKKIAQRGTQMYFRVPVILNSNDTEENMTRTAEFAKSLGVKHVDLLPFHAFAGQTYRLFGLDYPFPVGEGYPEKRVEELRKIFQSYDLETTIGGTY